METLDGIFLALGGQVEGQHGGGAPRLAPRALHGPELDTGCAPRRGRAVAEGRHAASALPEASALGGCTAGALDAAAMQGGGGGCQGCVITSRGGKKPGRLAGGCPGVS
jgi:hypothetical protein